MKNVLFLMLVPLAGALMVLGVAKAMTLTGQSPVVVSSLPTVQATVAFDLVAHTYTIVYGQPPQLVKTISGPIPTGLQTAIENHVQARIEANEGWTPDSSAVTP